jgi:hypothetical protein
MKAFLNEQPGMQQQSQAANSESLERLFRHYLYRSLMYPDLTVAEMPLPPEDASKISGKHNAARIITR